MFDWLLTEPRNNSGLTFLLLPSLQPLTTLNLHQCSFFLQPHGTRIAQDRTPMSSWPAPRPRWRNGLNSLGESLACPLEVRTPADFRGQVSVTSQAWGRSSCRRDASLNRVQGRPPQDNSKVILIAKPLLPSLGDSRKLEFSWKDCKPFALIRKCM